MNITEKFRFMVQLALIDNQFEEKEHAFIKELAKLQGISSDSLNGIIQEELSRKELSISTDYSLDFDSKIEILADLIRIMKVDGKIYLSEIKFCEMVANMFGFKKKTIGVLSGMIHQGSTGATNWALVQDKMKDLVAYN